MDIDTDGDGFAASRAQFTQVCTFLDGEQAGTLDHGGPRRATSGPAVRPRYPVPIAPH